MDTVTVGNKTYEVVRKGDNYCHGCAGYGDDKLCHALPDCTNHLIFVEKITMTNDKVNSPSHYTSGGIEAIDYIKAKLGTDGCIAYCLGNVIKYVSRAGKKGIQKELEDLKKAQWYLNKAVTLSSAEQAQLTSDEDYYVS